MLVKVDVFLTSAFPMVFEAYLSRNDRKINSNKPILVTAPNVKSRMKCRDILCAKLKDASLIQQMQQNSLKSLVLIKA